MAGDFEGGSPDPRESWRTPDIRARLRSRFTGRMPENSPFMQLLNRTMEEMEPPDTQGDTPSPFMNFRDRLNLPPLAGPSPTAGPPPGLDTMGPGFPGGPPIPGGVTFGGPPTQDPRKTKLGGFRGFGRLFGRPQPSMYDYDPGKI